MTRISRVIICGWIVALVLLASEASTTSGIKTSSTQQHGFQTTQQAKRQQLTTKSLIDSALIQTRGGWFRRKATATATAADNTTQSENITATLGEVVTSTPIQQAAELRKQGKVSHDEGNFEEAAKQFHQAANLLEALLGQEPEEGEEEQDDEAKAEGGEDASTGGGYSIKDAWSTCRFHESLCCLKAEDYEGCVEACTSLLDGEHSPPAMIRARAFHRRAKAKMALDDIDGALVDARSAAFLGDNKAVAYYGKLLRDTGGRAPVESALPSLDTSALFESMLGKSLPHTTEDSSGADSSRTSDGSSDFLTSSLLSSLGGGLPSPGGFAGAGNNGKGGGSLAKSVLNSLSKKLEDESTHDGICRYLQSTNPMQVETMASMAGIELPPGSASRLVELAHGITPKTIRRTVRLTKRGIWGFQLIRKTMALISKYRHLLFLAFLLQWTKSAIFRPIPVAKAQAPRVKGAPKVPAQPAPKAVQRNTPGGPTPNANAGGAGGAGGQQQQAGKKPLTPGGLLKRAEGGGLAALAADR